MILNERKIKILEAIINDYIATAEPIGSRTIAKKYELGISSATIRNEMSDLEEMGFIIQPHASSGRVPSDKGYRLYVDKLVKYRELTEDETDFLQRIIINNINQIDYLMQETAKAISLLTSYTTIITEPHNKKPKTHVKHIQLVPLDDKSVLLVIVCDGNAVKNHTITTAGAIDYETLSNLSLIFNNFLKENALSGDDINLDKLVAEQLTRAFDKHSYLLVPIINAIKNTISESDEGKVYTSGVKNMLSFPEFSDLEKARAIFQTLEEKELLITLLDNASSSDADKMQIVIGTENSFDQLKDCSIIKANYMLGTQVFGSIGIIGPTRMDYSQTVSILTGITKRLSSAINLLTGG